MQQRHGVSTRKVDALVKALGVDGISKSEVSRICGALDPVVAAFRTRPLTGGIGICGSMRRTTRSAWTGA